MIIIIIQDLVGVRLVVVFGVLAEVFITILS